MKAILEFNLPEEREEHELALNGRKYRLVLEDLDNKLRNLYKYHDQTDIKIEDVRAMICELEVEYGIVYD